MTRQRYPLEDPNNWLVSRVRFATEPRDALAAAPSAVEELRRAYFRQTGGVMWYAPARPQESNGPGETAAMGALDSAFARAMYDFTAGWAARSRMQLRGVRR